jgi:hypothetical protein
MEIKKIKEIVSSNIFPYIIKYDEYDILKTKNGQSWNRKSSCLAKTYKMIAIPSNKKITIGSWRYSSVSESDKKIVTDLIKEFRFGDNGNQTQGLIILGKIEVICNDRKSFSTQVIKDIKKRDGNCCVFCGSKNDLQIDHKDDEYNNIDTLTVDDGQQLCAHCNITKRGGNSYTRYDRNVPPFLQNLNKLFDMKNIYFWYDPRKWVNLIVNKLKEEIKLNIQLRKMLEERDAAIVKLNNDIDRYKRIELRK